MLRWLSMMRLGLSGAAAALAAVMVVLAGSPAGASTVTEHEMCEKRDGARLCYRATLMIDGIVGPIVELRIKKINGVDHARAIGWVPQGGQLWMEVRKNSGAPKRVKSVTAPTYTDGDGAPLMTTGPVWEYDGPGVSIRACTAAKDGRWLTCTKSH
ncbi:hypothetical protein M8Z33_42010 [Streptomyces sp. ZAF1911]|uniref:hypothetical protein n=1 Tax=Streptomyces sp. ZAF1911 TaxID=2944129 RepID=UPI00237BAE87|nr:hypothetical protein [Streptomyces sp. ZAF1911]MDD9383114.1 hypothetical protein [Streptomyces sp. ZAF1911]